MSARVASTTPTPAPVAGPSSPKPATPDINDFIQIPDSGDEEEAGLDDDVEQQDDDETEESSDDDIEEDQEDAGAESDDSITSERLNALLEKARVKARQLAAEKGDLGDIKLSDDRPLPKLDAGSLLPAPYFTTPTSEHAPAKLAIDPGAERLAKRAEKRKAEPEPERLTKKQRRELREKTAGPEWFDMPTPTGLELAKIKRELEAARLAAALDPKTFLRKEAMKEDVPKYVQLGKIVATNTPFERQSRKNLTRAERKKSIVDELVEDAEAKSYAKRKFLDLQGVKGERGKLTLRRRQEMKAARRKW